MVEILEGILWGALAILYGVSSAAALMELIENVVVGWDSPRPLMDWEEWTLISFYSSISLISGSILIVKLFWL